MRYAAGGGLTEQGRARREAVRLRAAEWFAQGIRVAEQGVWLCFEDVAGQTLRPPKACSWGRRGHTPQVPVSGTGPGRVLDWCAYGLATGLD